MPDNKIVYISKAHGDGTCKQKEVLMNTGYYGFPLFRYCEIQSVAYPGILFGEGVQQIQLRTEGMGIWGR